MEVLLLLRDRRQRGRHHMAARMSGGCLEDLHQYGRGDRLCFESGRCAVDDHPGFGRFEGGQQLCETIPGAGGQLEAVVAMPTGVGADDAWAGQPPPAAVWPPTLGFGGSQCGTGRGSPAFFPATGYFP